MACIFIMDKYKWLIPRLYKYISLEVCAAVTLGETVGGHLSNPAESGSACSGSRDQSVAYLPLSYN